VVRIIAFLIVSCLAFFCSEEISLQKQNKVIFTIQIILDPAAYKYTNFGEPPQLAVWIENQTLNDFYPVWVTHRSGNKDWIGKIECPVALPFWDNRKLHYKAKTIDIVTGATPKDGSLSVSSAKQGSGRWNYFIEVNASADYNKTFSYWSINKSPDSEGNGQPSLVYMGYIDFELKTAGRAKLIGRTAQFNVQDSIITNLDGITTAKNLIKKITVTF
jgi:hypothetical protein